MKVFVVFDTVIEKIISVHSTEEDAMKRVEEKIEEANYKYPGCIKYEEFEVEY